MLPYKLLIWTYIALYNQSLGPVYFDYVSLGPVYFDYVSLSLVYSGFSICKKVAGGKSWVAGA